MPVPLIKPPSKTSAQVDQFFLYEVELAGDAVTQFEPRPPVAYSVDDAILNMRVIDALFASEKTGAWVTV